MFSKLSIEGVYRWYEKFSQENEWTITAEWDLVCERAFLAPLITTTYFCGVMVTCPIDWIIWPMVGYH